MAYYYLDQPEEARKSYATALALNPGDFNVHYNLGELLYSVYNDPHRALEEFKKTVAINPDHPEANFKLGLICLGNKMYKEAALHLETAAKSDTGSIRILLQLGVAYELLDRRDDALRVYRTIVDKDALNPVALQKIKLLEK